MFLVVTYAFKIGVGFYCTVLHKLLLLYNLNLEFFTIKHLEHSVCRP